MEASSTSSSGSSFPCFDFNLAKWCCYERANTAFGHDGWTPVRWLLGKDAYVGFRSIITPVTPKEKDGQITHLDGVPWKIMKTPGLALQVKAKKGAFMFEEFPEASP